MSLPQHSMAWERLGARIRADRERQGLSRKALAERAGVSVGSVQSAEKGIVPKGRWPQSLSAIEKALTWGPDSMRRILQGGDPYYQTSNEDNFLTSAGEVDYDPGIPASEQNLEATQARSVQAGKYVPLGTAKVVETSAALKASARLAVGEFEITPWRLPQDVFARQMRRYRRLQGISTDELAKRVAEMDGSLDRLAIEKVEANTRAVRPAEADVLAEALGVSVDWLLGSGYRSDSPEELTAPPDEEELTIESDAIFHRLREAAARVNLAIQRQADAAERSARAEDEARYARMAAETAIAERAKLESRLNYLLGRLDTIRVARGEEVHPPYLPDGD
ncbi:helix-turn-helix domain-containing protein [Streptomyces sp. NPDC059477]|uniref:helix-turn-helix domain-containing protein n=1 Tax=Streptomyces sp. NPDC059477 TaxID=3346847 RepID=UPI0036AC293E